MYKLKISDILTKTLSRLHVKININVTTKRYSTLKYMISLDESVIFEIINTHNI